MWSATLCIYKFAETGMTGWTMVRLFLGIPWYHTRMHRGPPMKNNTHQSALPSSRSLNLILTLPLYLWPAVTLSLSGKHTQTCTHDTHTNIHCSFPSVSKLQESCSLFLISGLLLIQLLWLFQIRRRSASSWLVGWSLCEGILIKPD